MSCLTLSPEDRKILIQSILQSDIKYLDKLLHRKVQLLQEFQSLEVSIIKKTSEIENLQAQFKFVDTWS